MTQTPKENTQTKDSRGDVKSPQKKDRNNVAIRTDIRAGKYHVK